MLGVAFLDGYGSLKPSMSSTFRADKKPTQGDIIAQIKRSALHVVRSRYKSSSVKGNGSQRGFGLSIITPFSSSIQSLTGVASQECISGHSLSSLRNLSQNLLVTKKLEGLV